jgi:hypothetical protein
MASTLRETLSNSAPKYWKHPAAGNASSFVANGKPMDAGTWSRYVNNYSVLHWEGTRHVLCDVGPGDVSISEGGDWDALSETIPDEDQRSGNTHQEISWRLIAGSSVNERPNARVYGPFPVIFDRAELDTGPEIYARAYRITATLYGTTDFTMYAALTSSLRPPSEGYLDLETFDATGTSAASPETMDKYLVPVMRIDSSSPEKRHSSGYADDGSSIVHVHECYLWLGWKMAGAGTSGWLSVSAWELLDVDTAS